MTEGDAQLVKLARAVTFADEMGLDFFDAALADLRMALDPGPTWTLLEDAPVAAASGQHDRLPATTRVRVVL